MKFNKNKKNAETKEIVIETDTPIVKSSNLNNIDLNQIKDYQKELLRDYAESVVNYITPKLAENGFIADNGTIVEVGNLGYSGFIPAVALSIDDNEVETIPTAIACSINRGFRYVAPGLADRLHPNGYTIDNGPVGMPTVIGNTERPYALLVPLGDSKAIHDSIDLLSTRYENMVSQDDACNELDSGCGCHDICHKKNGNSKW